MPVTAGSFKLEDNVVENRTGRLICDHLMDRLLIFLIFFLFLSFGRFCRESTPGSCEPRKFESHQVHFTVSGMTTFHIMQVCRKYPIGSRERAADARQKWTLGSYLFYSSTNIQQTQKKFWSPPCIMGSMAYRREVSPALGDCDRGFACDLHNGRVFVCLDESNL
jgi:hypothetical protein